MYIQKPGREGLSTELLTYMAEVQSITEDGLDWAMNDEQYRWECASSEAPFSWATVNQTLHNKILHKRLITVMSPASPGFLLSVLPTPTWVALQSVRIFTTKLVAYQQGSACFEFNSPGKYCSKSPCTYKHTCFKCKGGKPHPQFLYRTKNDRQRQPAITDKSWMSSGAPVGL